MLSLPAERMSRLTGTLTGPFAIPHEPGKNYWLEVPPSPLVMEDYVHTPCRRCNKDIRQLTDGMDLTIGDILEDYRRYGLCGSCQHADDMAAYSACAS